MNKTCWLYAIHLLLLIYLLEFVLSELSNMPIADLLQLKEKLGAKVCVFDCFLLWNNIILLL